MNVKRKIIPVLLLSLSTSVLFILGFIFFAGKSRVDSLLILFMTNFILFCGIPLFIYLVYAKIKTYKEIFLWNLLVSLLVAAPASAFLGWIFATFQMDEFDIPHFNLSLFLTMFSACFTLFSLTTYILLTIGEIIKLNLPKKLIA